MDSRTLWRYGAEMAKNTDKWYFLQGGLLRDWHYKGSGAVAMQTLYFHSGNIDWVFAR